MYRAFPILLAVLVLLVPAFVQAQGLLVVADPDRSSGCRGRSSSGRRIRIPIRIPSRPRRRR